MGGGGGRLTPGLWDKTCWGSSHPQNRVGALGQKHEGVLVQK